MYGLFISLNVFKSAVTIFILSQKNVKQESVQKLLTNISFHKFFVRIKYKHETKWRYYIEVNNT